MFKPISIAAFVMLLLCSCKKDKESEKLPNACFQTNERMYKSGETVFFQNCSENFDRVEWNFGNGQLSAAENPTFSWIEKGRHEVNLTVFKNGQSSNVSRRVTIADSTYAGFRADFSAWDSTYKDSLFTVSIYTMEGVDINTQFTQQGKPGSFAFVDPPVHGKDVDSEFLIRLIVQTQGGQKDSITTGPFMITGAVNNFITLRSPLKFVTVDHIYTIVCK